MHTDKNIIDDQLSLADMLNDSSIDRVMAIDNNWNIIAWNKTSELISGFLRKDVLGKNLLDLFPGITTDKEIITSLKEAFSGRKIFLPSNTVSFNRQYIENHYIPLKDCSGEIIGVMNIMHDVAHRIKDDKHLGKLNSALEKKYIQLEKANNDLATFTYIAGRDIKEPIKHVYTSLELMARKEGMNLSNTSRGNVRKIQASLNRMNLLLDDILAISRFSNYNIQFETIDLNEMLDKVRDSMNDKLNAKSVVITTEKLPVVKGSSEMIGYLFHHLIDNAIKFQKVDNFPVIHIRSSTISQEGQENETGAYYEISFTDNGVGFNPKDAERIFNMFERLQKNEFRGSGIGLAICKKIMDSHDGLIIADSTVGEGSIFKCYFPTGEND
jgi:PAS domain S-box-containing protein